MVPYQSFRLREFPNMADAKREGRQNRRGPKIGKDGYVSRPALKRRVRRTLKRRDRAQTAHADARMLHVECTQDMAELDSIEQEDGLYDFFDDLLWFEHQREDFYTDFD